VAFDNDVQVVVPAGPLLDKEGVRQRVRAIYPGGMTDLAGGVMRGLQEVRRVKTNGSATIVLLSDGHANQGATAPESLGCVGGAGGGA